MEKGFIVQAPSKAASLIARHPQLHAAAQKIHWMGWIFVGMLALCDVWLALDKIEGNTWSELMRHYGQQHLILPWLCGILIGHLFHQKDTLQPWGKLSSQQASSLIFWLSAFFFFIGSGAFVFNQSFPPSLMTAVSFLGLGAGHFFWPIRRDPDKWKW